MLRAVIFDRDGVLTRFDFTAAQALFAELGLSLDGLMPRWARWCAAVPLPRAVDEEQRFLAGFWDAVSTEKGLGPAQHAKLVAFDYTQAIRPFPDARPALLAARRRGLRIGVLSNFPLASLVASLSAADLVDLVDVAAPAAVIGAAKPDPRAYLHVLNRLGVSADETLMFDDEAPCVAGARAVGITAYLVDRTLRERAPPGTLGGLDGVEALLDWVQIHGQPSPSP